TWSTWSTSTVPSLHYRRAMTKKSRFALIDGSNVAHSTEGGTARLANLLLMRDRLAAKGLEPIIVVDAALRHQIDDAAAYEKMVDDGELKQAPAGTDADYFILSFARELGARVVSNDRFRDRMPEFKDVSRRFIRYMIVEGEVVFEQRNGRRTRSP
ncbi:MAG TPA: hypothetical protein VFH14_11505, partial [Gemmatimonadaceae bacterium]|nr:hypothetical protein [Gemmatimonadaceae bacterium]